MPQTPHSPEPFFVGYLPTPPALRPWLWAVVSAVLLGGAALAGWVASRQRSPGDAAWAPEAVVIEGVLTDRPCPILWVGGSDAEPVLLVGVGKRGLAPDDAARRPAWSRVTGTVLSRDGYRMMEVERMEPATSPQAAPTPPTPVDLGEATLRGEVVDPKCYLGAMKPGDGKTHKACATLCIRGGVPAMLRIARGGTGSLVLLADERGDPPRGEALEELLPFVADRVVVHGRALRLGALTVLSLEPDGIRRDADP